MPSLIFFEVGSQNLAIKTEFVTEIIRAVTITTLPEQPKPFAGVINYRGKILPVVRMGNFFGVSSQSTELTAYMIIVDDGSPTGICLVVDQVTAFKTVDEVLSMTELDNPGIQSRLTPEIVKLETGLVPVIEVSALTRPASITLEPLKLSSKERLN